MSKREYKHSVDSTAQELLGHQTWVLQHFGEFTVEEQARLVYAVRLFEGALSEIYEKYNAPEELQGVKII